MKTIAKKIGIDFDLRQLEVFCKVVEEKSFSKAAQIFHLAQASVSERVASLEQAVGARLLDRTGRKINTTKAGEVLYRCALKHLDLKRKTCLELEAFLGVKKGDIDIGGSTIPGEYIIPKMIKLFYTSYPDVTIRLAIGDSEEISNKISEGLLEFGVVGARTRAKGLVFKEAWKDELVLVVSAEHRWSRSGPITLKELLTEPFVMRESGSGTRRMLQHYLEKMEATELETLRVVAQLGSTTAIKEAIQENLGVSILSSRAIATELASKTLCVVPIQNVVLERKFFLARSRKRVLSPLAKTLYEFLEREASDSQPESSDNTQTE